uniref:HTH psq-type domain-containing protein n=1 Tax=Branchiostoma floridae TaxID=7739 RepID=C3ZTM8_BRAFL|eukprot:XP_002588124.1 hypothetical protein BRAFLDRAFT_124951 [Branchiostoma floridae]
MREGKLSRHQGRSKHSRQTYSPSDLSRALHDVRAGKLGTRKASNVYGVPRSTIRNYLNRKNCENLSAPKQVAEKVTGSEGLPLKGGNRLRTLLESVSGKAQAVLEREAILRRALNSHKESVLDKGKHKQSYANEIKLPITSSILRSLAVARMQEIQDKDKRDHRETQVPKVRKKAIQLKIPRVAQRGRTEVEQNENAETTSQQLKTKLRSTIVSRGGFQMDRHPRESSLFGRNLSQPSAGNSGNSHHSEASSRDANNSPRRKRGRYRCYTPDDLETAVSMVTMGLMSISRAQQLYRIPHSTLEYKVKERRTELKEAAERNRLFYYPSYMHGGSGGGGGGASPYPSPFFQWAWPRSQYFAQEYAEQDEDNNDSDDPPPPILSPMPTMYWATAFCPALRKEPQGCKVENHVLSTKKTAALASLSAPPKFVRKQTRGNSQVEEKDDEGKNVMKLGIRTLPHRRARTKVLKAFHTVVLKKYQKPESFMPAAIRRLRLLPSRHKRLRESTKSMPCLSKKSRKHLLVTLQKTTDCKISQKHCPTRDLRIGPNCPTDSNKDDGNKPTPIKHTKLILQDGTDRQYDCKGAEEPMQVEQRSIVLHPRSPPTASAGVSGIQHSCPNESEVNMTRIDMPVVKRELDQPMTKSVVEVYEKRQLRVLPERVARLREEERKQQAENTVTMTRASPSLKKLIDCQNNSAFDKDAETEDMETKSLSIEIAEKPVVLNDSKSNSEYSKHLVSEGISGRMSHTCNNVQVETRTQYTSCKIEVEDDERKLRSLPCRMVAQSNNSQEMPKARKRPRKHSPLSSDAEFMANVHQGRPRNYVLSESLNNTIYTKKHAKHVMETVSAELKSGSICVDQAMKLDHGSLETANNNQPNLVKSSHPNEVTSDRELDTAIALSSNQEENSKTEIDTTDMEAAASTCDILVKRKVTRCPKTDLRYNCMSLNTSLTLQYKDAIISNGWVKTSEKPGTGSGDGSLIQSLFTQPVTYDTVMRLVGVGSSKTRLCQSREQVALTQVTSSPQCEKYIHTQHNSTKCSKTKKKGFEEVSMTKDLAEAVPISPSKPIMNPSTTLRATKQQKTPKTKIDRQADRLRKTLRKFATMTPAKNRIIPYEDVGRRKCKAAKKLFVVQSNPSILWCHHPSSDSKTKGPKPKLSSNAVSLSGAKDNSNLNAQQGAKGRIENSSHTSSTTVSASSSDGLCRERGNLTVSPENVKISQGKKTLKKCSILPSFTSTGHDLGKAKPEKASNKKHKVDPVQAIEKSDHRDECPSNTAQASRSSVRIQKKRLLGFSICPCCALVEAEHFKRFNKRVKITKSNEKHQTEKVDSPAKHRKQLQVAKNANEVSVSASQLDKPFNLVSKTKAKNKLATKEKIQKSNKDRGSPRRYVNSSSDFPPVTSTSSKAVDSDVPEDLSYHVPQLGRSTSSPLISSTEQTVLSQWDTPTHGEKIPKEYPGVKDQVTYPEVNALVQNGKVFSECEDVFSSPCEKNELLDEERFVGPLDLRVSWKKDEPR